MDEIIVDKFKRFLDKNIVLDDDVDEEKYDRSLQIMLNNMQKFYNKYAKKDDKKILVRSKKEKKKEKISTINIYTDGSLRRTKKGIFCGYGIHFANHELPDISEPFTIEPITNNRAELYAILRAIKLVSKTFEFKELNIYTDSEYSQKSLTQWIKGWRKKNWKNSKGDPVENQDIIREIDKYFERYADRINIHWIPSHTGKEDIHSRGNAIADELANVGAMESLR